MSYVGENYQAVKGLDVAQVAKLIRSDIKSAISAGEIPDGKYSVKISRFANGRSIDVSITNVDDFLNIETIVAIANGANEFNAGPRYSKKGVEILNKINAIVQSYNYDNSDSSRDYFHVSFYSNVRFDWMFEDAVRKNIELNIKKSA